MMQFKLTLQTSVIIIFCSFQHYFSSYLSQNNLFWIDESDGKWDYHRLNNGENLIYLSIGSLSFTVDSLTNIRNSFKTQKCNIECLNITKTKLKNINQFTKFDKKELNIILVYGIEQIINDSIRDLDFLFRLTDSSSDVRKTLILLSYNNESLKKELNSNENDDFSKVWKEKMSNLLNNENLFFNGMAFVGRISRTAVESENYYEKLQNNKNSTDVFCSHVEEKIIFIWKEKNWLTMFLISILLIFSYFMVGIITNTFRDVFNVSTKNKNDKMELNDSNTKNELNNQNNENIKQGFKSDDTESEMGNTVKAPKTKNKRKYTKRALNESKVVTRSQTKKKLNKSKKEID